MARFPLDPSAYLVAITTESAAVGAAATRAPTAVIESCPGWDMDELLSHLGTLHRRIAAMVSAEAPRRIDRHELPDVPPPGQRVPWFNEGAAALVQALEGAGTDRPCWTLDDPIGTSAFWFRRMAQETQMHRVDAELAAGTPSRFSPLLAADGVDELFGVHLPRRLRRAAIPGLEASALVVALDTEARWHVTLTPEQVLTEQSGEATARIAGPAGALLCYLWNRGGDNEIEMSGASGVFQRWAALVQM